MSLFDYRRGLELFRQDQPFHALIMAAMLRADTGNAAILRAAFPDVRAELEARYNAPGGVLAGEPGRDEIDAARAALGIGNE